MSLIAEKDIEGIGAYSSGKLQFKNYTAFGKFTIYDEFQYDAGEDENVYLSKDDYLSPTWDLNITSDKGWKIKE